MRRLLLASVLATLLVPATAQAEESLTYRYGPISIGPYEVNLRELVADLPKPQVDGYLTGMEANVVDAQGNKLPVSRVMLHHVVFANLGRRVGERKDPMCDRITLLDGRSQYPAYAERFFGVGEERVSGRLPDGYGYPVKGDDRWGATWMLMNHRNRTDAVYLQYTVRYETQRALTPVQLLWFDVRNCSFDPIYDVPGGGRPGSTHTESTTWTMPWAGRVVAALGHVHGGGKEVDVSQPDCANRTLLRSRARWARPFDPENRVRPLVHEPGPIDMETVLSKQGFPIAAGERLRLSARYDAQLPHTRVMGIMGMFVTRDPSVTQPCGALPTDVQTVRKSRPGLSSPPLLRIPINARSAGGRVGPVAGGPGAATWLGGGPLEVRSLLVEPANAVVPVGSRVRWRFWGSALHTVTVAGGPEGFSSPNLSDGRAFEHRFTRPGTYRLYCSLHPVDMPSTVRVLPRR
ncbi:MAG: hypothetical protein QOI91_1601 [Solirubrobacteraceae bacterium]|jgi:hypothetical protein|nr:hypothetical protein [Solirubrobacteraceae bacterium]